MDKDQVRVSRFLSLVLRHKPEVAGLDLDGSGRCGVEELLKGCALRGHRISREELDAIVAENDKKRFEFSVDRRRIRASQGHSIEIDLKYDPKTPPEILYHGHRDAVSRSHQADGVDKRLPTARPSFHSCADCFKGGRTTRQTCGRTG